jgi:hypothetical protein
MAKKIKGKNFVIKFEVSFLFLFLTFCVFGLFVAYELTIVFLLLQVVGYINPFNIPFVANRGNVFHTTNVKT